jgi:SMI1/KNR4 family protein SUKH-1
LFEKYEVDLPAAQVRPVGKPTEQDLDKAETRLGASLPGSYREFARDIGPGILCDWFRIYAPCMDSEYADLVTYAEGTRRALPGEDHPLAFPFPVKDLVAFADTMAGDCFGFHPREGTGDDEYAIYVMPGEPPPGVVRVADSFIDFIDNVVFGNRLVDLKLCSSASWPMTWEPFYLPGKGRA